MSILVKRDYDPPSSEDGYRVLVDRLWPRGLSHALAQLDLWLRDLSPSTEPRTWYDNEVERWPDFQRRYAKEVEDHGALLDLLLDIERHRQPAAAFRGPRSRTERSSGPCRRARARPRHSHD
jgi:uncharacterized protein YeaO (DUF488 family)